MVGLFFTAPEIITLFSGNEFLPSITTIQILSPVVLIIGITTNFSTQLLIPMGKDRQLLCAVLCGTLVSLILNFILIPLFLHNGAAISNLIAEAVVLFMCYIFARRHIIVIIPYKEIIINIIICLPFAGFVFISRYFLSSPILILFITITISAFYYLMFQLLIIKNDLMVELKEMIFNKIYTQLKY